MYRAGWEPLVQTKEVPSSSQVGTGLREAHKVWLRVLVPSGHLGQRAVCWAVMESPGTGVEQAVRSRARWVESRGFWKPGPLCRDGNVAVAARAGGSWKPLSGEPGPGSGQVVTGLPRSKPS